MLLHEVHMTLIRVISLLDRISLNRGEDCFENYRYACRTHETAVFISLPIIHLFVKYSNEQNQLS